MTIQRMTGGVTSAPQLLLAMIMIGVLLVQLFTFDRFVMSAVLGPYAHQAAIVLVVSELLALPYLLGMRGSVLLRAASGVCVVLALVLLGTMELAAQLEGESVVFGAAMRRGRLLPVLVVVMMWLLAIGGCARGRRRQGLGRTVPVK